MHALILAALLVGPPPRPLTLASPVVERWDATCPCGESCPCFGCGCEWKAEHIRASYDEASRQAQAQRKRLVVFVGEQLRDIPGCICLSAETFPGIRDTGIVVGVPDGRPGLARYDLGRYATDLQVLAAGSTPPPLLTYQFVQYPVFFGGGCANGRCGR